MSEIRTGYSYIEYTGDGITDTYAVNFTLGYLRPAFVTCQVNSEEDGIGNPIYRALTFLPGDTGMVQIGGAVPGVGESIVFRRVIPKDLLMHMYSNGSILDYPSLDESHLQLMMALQEVLDGFGLANIYTDIDMHGFRIVGVLADPSVPTSVVTFEELQKFSADVQALTVLGTPEGASFVGYGSTTVEEHLDALAAPNGSSLVGFLQAGTGAGARTVQDKLRDVVSVKDFGAVGDGVTDDTAAVQKAIDYAKTNGCAIHAPHGIYIVGQLDVGSGVKGWALVGDGPESTFFKHKDGNGTLMFGLSSLAGFSLRGLSIDCMFSEYAHASANHGVVIENTSNVSIEDVFVRNYKNSAIILISSSPGTHDNCLIKGCRADGLDAASNGFLMVNMWRSGYINCKATGALSSPGYGVQFKNDCRYCFISDCYSEGNRAGFAFGQETGDGVKFCTCNNLHAVGNTVWGFVLGYASYNKIDNLYVDCGNLSGCNGFEAQNSVGNSVNLTLENLAANRSAVRFTGTSSDNHAEITNMRSITGTSYAVAFEDAVSNNTVLLHRSSSPAKPASGYINKFAAFNSSENTNIFRHTAYPTNDFLYITSDSITLKNPAVEHIVLDTEALASTDSLSTISGSMDDGRIIYLRTVANARDVTILHNIGNILLENATSVVLDHTSDSIMLRWNATLSAWTQLAFTTPI